MSKSSEPRTAARTWFDLMRYLAEHGVTFFVAAGDKPQDAWQLVVYHDTRRKSTLPTSCRGKLFAPMDMMQPADVKRAVRLLKDMGLSQR